MDRDRPVSTRDVAAAGDDDIRGRREEAIANREGIVERPAPAPAPAGTTPAAENRVRAASPRQDSVHDERASLFGDTDVEALRKRWSDVQGGFVDEPRKAVTEADALVADVMKRLAESFANERTSLEHQWDRGDKVTTEDLRVALQRYRSFFDRLLSV